MKYLKSYETYIDYTEAFNNGEIEAPNVSLIKDEARCLYHPKNKSNFGDVVLFDRDTNEYIFVDPDSYLEGYWQDLKKFPIGVVAVPTKYTPDGSTRVISLKNMSMKDPVNGTAKTGGSGGENNMYWGGNGVDIPTLKNYTQTASINPKTGEFSAMIDWVNIPSDTKFSNRYVDPNGFYYYDSLNSNNNRKGPYPILGNGEKNPIFYEQENSAMTDFEGKENTEKIVAMAEGTDYANWKTASTYVHGYAAGNYPPAFCCKRFKTLYGTNSGDWYLPAIGEAMFMTSHYGAINKGLTAVATARGASEAVRIGRDNSTYGTWLWSSSEYSSSNARNVSCNYGHCNYNGKSFTNTNNRVRAFLRI